MDKLLKYITGEADDAEKKEIERLLKTDAEARKEAEKLRIIWENASKSKTVPVDTEKAWAHVRQRINAEQNARPASNKQTITRKKRMRWRTLSQIAAAVVMGLILSYIAYNQYIKTENVPLLAEISTHQIKHLTLADGSKITLNKNSKLTYPEKFTGTSREVTLEGEAFFEIQHLERQPFIVRASNTEIKVLGTKFNVSTRKIDSVEVAVESGKVAFYVPDKSANSEVILTKGEKGIYAQKSRQITEFQGHSMNDTAWKTRLLRFEDTPISEVIRHLNQFYNTHILATENLRNCRLTAKFSNKSLDEVLETLGFMFEVKIEKSDQYIKLVGGNCTPD